MEENKQRKKLIIGKKSGRLGNRLMLFAHIIAFAKENDFKVFNFAFFEYARYFESTRDDIFCRYPIKTLAIPSLKIRILLYRIFQRITNIIYKSKFMQKFVRIIEIEKGQVIRLDSKDFMDKIRSKKIIILRGFIFRDLVNFVKYSNVIRSYFTPIDSHQMNIDRLIKKIKNIADVIVGVHIRHGDFRKYKEGKYYFSFDQYKELMKKIENLFRSQKVVFLICSDGKLTHSIFNDFSFEFGTGHLVEDMYSLARCDYLIGTKSTFLRWASFYGEVPMYEIEDPNSSLRLNYFKEFKPSKETLPQFRYL